MEIFKRYSEIWTISSVIQEKRKERNQDSRKREKALSGVSASFDIEEEGVMGKRSFTNAETLKPRGFRERSDASLEQAIKILFFISFQKANSQGIGFFV